MITISSPKPDDAKDINEVIKASWYSTYIDEKIGITKKDIDLMYLESEGKQIEALKYRTLNPKNDDISLVAKEENKVVGFIRLKIHEDHIQCLSLYVLPEYSGKGIGTKLWNVAYKLLPKNLPISVEVASYTKAVDFYKKIGFVETGEIYLHSEPTKSSGVYIPLMKMILKEFK